MHAKSVLLVDHDQAEIAERDCVLEQRMRADQNVELPRFERSQDRLALLAALAAGEQRDAQIGCRAERADGLQMLAGEQLGRRHQRSLRPGLDRGGEREQRDDRLATADIALQQPEHAMRAGEVGVDLGERADLCARELEGKLGDDRLAELARCDKLPARALRHALSNDGKRKLIGQQLVISKPAAGRGRRREIGLALRRMQAGESVGERRPSVSRAERLVDPFGQRGQPRQSLADRLAQDGVGETRGQGIERLVQRQRAVAALLFAIDRHHMIGVGHLQPAVIGLELARDELATPRRQQPLQIGRVGVEIDELDRGA